MSGIDRLSHFREDTPSSPMPTASALTTITTDLGDLSTSLVSPAGDDDEDETAIEITPSPSGQISAVWASFYSRITITVTVRPSPLGLLGGLTV